MSITLTLEESELYTKGFDPFDLLTYVEVSSGTLYLPRLKPGKVLKVLTDDDVYQVYVCDQLTSPMGYQATCVRVRKKWNSQSWSELGLYIASLIRIGDQMVMVPSDQWDASMVGSPVRSITIEPGTASLLI